MSIGSPGRPSSSTTEPCASSSSCLMVRRVRPSSTLSFTGMSMIISRSRALTPSAFALSGWNTSAPALRGVAIGLASAVGAAACSASASAHGSASAVAVAACSFRSSAASGLAADFAAFFTVGLLMVGFLGCWQVPFDKDFGGSAVRVGMVDDALHAQRALILVAAVLTLEHRHAADARGHRFRQFDRQHVAHLQRAHLADAAGYRDEFGHQVHFGVAQLAGHALGPRLIVALVRADGRV